MRIWTHNIFEIVKTPSVLRDSETRCSPGVDEAPGVLSSCLRGSQHRRATKDGPLGRSFRVVLRSRIWALTLLFLVWVDFEALASSLYMYMMDIEGFEIRTS